MSLKKILLNSRISRDKGTNAKPALVRELNIL